jgi:hypothetical protein
LAGPKEYLDSFALLSRDTTEEQRRSLWRQGIATLARAAIAQQPVPLEGINPDLLLKAVGTALNAGLVDELDWLSPPAAAAAIYELAAAIPESPQRRELGRRVVARLNEGDARTFVALATSLAAESRRLLTGPTMRARVALALELPAGKGVSADALALALISRPDLRREWLVDPSSGSLPSRRIAARLLERAARESARRAQLGDTGSLRTFEEPSVAGAWNRLLADRESLVWRHVAVARGLLARAMPDMAEEIDRHLGTDLTPTEWRRAAVSLVAGIGTEPDKALASCLKLLEDRSLRRDMGLAGAMVFGLGPAAEAEPEAAETLLDEVVRVGGLEASEALVELRREFADVPFGDRAAEYARTWLQGLLEKRRIDDDGRVALCEALIQELSSLSERARPTLRDSLDLALDAFVEKSARQAHTEARLVFQAALEVVAGLEQGQEDDAEGRRNTFRALRELDVAVLVNATLYDLLAVGARGKGDGDATSSLDVLFERFTNWMLRREHKPIESSASIRHLTLRLTRMRTLLHLVDSDGSYGEDITGQRRERRKRTAALLLRRASEDVPSPLRRVVCAALARSCDALVRDGLHELSDVFVAVADNVSAEHDLHTLAEASMMPDFQPLMTAYAGLVHVVQESKRSGRQVRAALDAVEQLAQSLPWTSSLRVSALRSGLLDLGRDLEVIASARSLQELTEAAEGSIMERAGATVSALTQITMGARWRTEESRARDLPASSEGLYMLERAIRRELQESTEMFEEVVSMVSGTLRQELPPAIAEAVAVVLERIRTYPAVGPPARYDSFVPPPPKEAPLPPWMPPHRTMGGFYVVRALGRGGVASVFVVKRVEEKQVETAENFALKVPDYNAEVARTLSEEEFLTLFRDEAGALLALPFHRNLARFVTFDAGARPKPILVMELVEGPMLERVIDRGDLDMHKAFALLDGVGAGLANMHRVGIGHLDIKPANVILRESGKVKGGGKSTLPTPVLVDFGLAGRHLRPGCATGPYGAPEIWGLFENEIPHPSPLAADTYAYACLCYEVLTGDVLFEAPDELATINSHLGHDGDPPRLQALRRTRGLDVLCDQIANALRRHPSDRITVEELREGIAELGPGLYNRPWPLRPAD